MREREGKGEGRGEEDWVGAAAYAWRKVLYCIFSRIKPRIAWDALLSNGNAYYSILDRLLKQRPDPAQP